MHMYASHPAMGSISIKKGSKIYLSCAYKDNELIQKEVKLGGK